MFERNCSESEPYFAGGRRRRESSHTTNDF